jgi:dTDP-glucose 4,6-dehydratase
MNYAKRILITGGAGFIGSHVVRLFINKYPSYLIVNFDLLTYAGNLENLRDIENNGNYRFERGDVADQERAEEVFNQYEITDVIHLAAESHVDRSIEDPLAFARTNVMGTLNLLNIARRAWNGEDGHRFYHISTDEVYGSLGDEGLFEETTPYDPHSPYSASKASSDHFVRAFHDTYGMDVVISNCSNNYGPNQFPEKLIPLVIHNILNGKEIPVYGDGMNVRDWLYVEDHATSIDVIFHKGRSGQTYNVGGNNEQTNIDLVKLLCDKVDEHTGKEVGSSRELITFVKDRPGHDRRYAIDASKIKNELGWEPRTNAEEGIRKTIEWYTSNEEWLSHVTSGAYRQYYDRMYANR